MMTDDRRLGVADMLEQMYGDVVAKFDDALATVAVLEHRLRSGIGDPRAAVEVLEHRLGAMKRTLLQDLRGAAQVLRDDGEPK
jgi:hypothetical protein